jgi:hypothetical protein
MKSPFKPANPITIFNRNKSETRKKLENLDSNFIRLDPVFVKGKKPDFNKSLHTITVFFLFSDSSFFQRL